MRDCGTGARGQTRRKERGAGLRSAGLPRPSERVDEDRAAELRERPEGGGEGSDESPLALPVETG